jgi:NAD(P)-dependent dehydrogenase (short-subunit alcohol dehydrogenase family)
MDLQLKGKVVLVTGGSKGIGLACARTFAQEGAKVAIAARNEAGLQQAVAELAAEGLEAHGFAADLTDPAQAADLRARVEAKLGPVGVLVNSAGAAKRIPAQSLTAANWHAAMEAKYFTYIHAMEAVLSGMAARGTGTVVNVIGMGGRVASPMHLAGGAANAALMLVSSGLANAYAKHGIRVNAINPGTVETDRFHQRVEAEAAAGGLNREQIVSQLTSKLPMGRLAQADEVADMVVFLASGRARYVNGAVIAMDGAATAIP